MKFEEAKEKFIQAWGAFGSNWGINRTMSSMHALLMVTEAPLSTEDIMEQLQISRGNVNMNIRELIDWGLVRKEYRSGERKDLFVAEKDIWKVAKQIIENRKKRELEPMLRLLQEVRDFDYTKSNPDEKAFMNTVKDIETFAHQADKTLDKMIRADEHWFLGTFLKLFK
jgi:DNA-binding transcriptional regulator GbsR (MarR family)